MKNFYKGKKILVTGGAGFIGSHIVSALLEKGAITTAVVRNVSRIQNLADTKDRILIKEADLTNKKQMKLLLKDQQIVIHAAAVDGGTLFKKTHAGRIFHENVHMTMNILESLKKSSVEKFIFVSTAEVYTNLKDKRRIKEEDFQLFAPERPEQWYAFSKIIGEYSTQLIGNTLGIQVIIVRPANIYGPKDNAGKKRLVPLLLKSAKDKKKTYSLRGTGLDIRSFLHVEDYVENLLQLIEKSQGGTYNLAGSKAVRIKEFTKIFSDLSGTKVSFKDKKSRPNKKKDTFLLDLSKTKALIEDWRDTPYKKRLKELLKNL